MGAFPTIPRISYHACTQRSVKSLAKILFQATKMHSIIITMCIALPGTAILQTSNQARKQPLTYDMLRKSSILEPSRLLPVYALITACDQC